MAITRPTAPDPSVARPIPHTGDMVLDLYPTIREYLTQEAYTDGSSRQTATLLLFAEKGLFKCCLSDRDLSRKAWSSGQSAEEAVNRMEQALATDGADWRDDQRARRR